MKSDPVRSAVRTSAFEGVPDSASGDMEGGMLRRISACCAASVPGGAANAAAPTAAVLRKFRRSTAAFSGLAMTFHLWLRSFTVYTIVRNEPAICATEFEVHAII